VSSIISASGENAGDQGREQNIFHLVCGNIHTKRFRFSYSHTHTHTHTHTLRVFTYLYNRNFERKTVPTQVIHILTRMGIIYT